MKITNESFQSVSMSSIFKFLFPDCKCFYEIVGRTTGKSLKELLEEQESNSKTTPARDNNSQNWKYQNLQIKKDASFTSQYHLPKHVGYEKQYNNKGRKKQYGHINKTGHLCKEVRIRH